MPVFKKFVEVGRVVHVTDGKYAGKLGVIQNIVDANRLLVRGKDFKPDEVKLRDCYLTKMKLKMDHMINRSAFLKIWKDDLVEARYKRTVHAQRIAQHETRKNLTDFEYFKAGAARRTCNKIMDSAFRQLREKHPRALGRIKKHCRIDLAVKLGLAKRVKLSDKKKARIAARKTIRKANHKVKSLQRYKEKKELRAKKREVRKAKLAKLAKEGKLEKREFVAKEDRKSKPKTHKKEPHVSGIKQMRRDRDAQRKANKEHNREVAKTLAVYKAAVKKAVANKQPRPAAPAVKFVLKPTHFKQVTKSKNASDRSRVARKKAVKKAAEKKTKAEESAKKLAAKKAEKAAKKAKKAEKAKK